VRKSLAAVTQGTFADPGQRALRRVLNAVAGSVRTAEEFKSRMTSLLNSVPVGCIPIPIEHLMITTGRHRGYLSRRLKSAMPRRQRHDYHTGARHGALDLSAQQQSL
jgi:hypothetical protein